MRAIIIGAGNAGSNLATKLCEEKHDVILIDRQASVLNALEAQLDILTFQGHGASPDLLGRAGIDKADLVVGVTNNDDVNILACIQAARAGVANKVARISHTDYLKTLPHFDLQAFGVDLAINPRRECAGEIQNMLRLPGTQEVIDMLEGRVLAAGFALTENSPLTGVRLAEFPEPDRLAHVRFIALLRGGDLTIPYGDTRFEQGDNVYIAGRPEAVRDFLSWCRPDRRNIEKVIIAGGGELGMNLARRLESEFTTVLIENDSDRAEACAGELDKTLVIRGSTLSPDTLQNAGFTDGTAYIAATGDDENNIIGCLLADKRGADYTIAQVTQPEYVPIIQDLTLLDRAVSTHLSTINSILHYIRGKNVRAASLMHTLPGELLEVDLAESSRWVHKPISNLRAPKGSIIVAVQRDEQVLPATGDLVLNEGDRLVIFSTPASVAKLKSICCS